MFHPSHLDASIRRSFTGQCDCCSLVHIRAKRARLDVTCVVHQHRGDTSMAQCCIIPSVAPVVGAMPGPACVRPAGPLMRDARMLYTEFGKQCSATTPRRHMLCIGPPLQITTISLYKVRSSSISACLTQPGRYQTYGWSHARCAPHDHIIADIRIPPHRG